MAEEPSSDRASPSSARAELQNISRTSPGSHASPCSYTSSATLPWVFYRRDGYTEGLREAGLETDENLVLWLSSSQQQSQTDRLAHYLHQQRPTAVLFGCFAAVKFLAPLVASGSLRVPQDLSVVNFDQHAQCAGWLGGVSPTTVALPLHAMGRHLAQMAHEIVEQKQLPAVTQLPCHLVHGDSVAAPAS